MLGTMMSAPADAGLNPEDKGYEVLIWI